MIQAVLFLTPLITGIGNRILRGEGALPRWQWYLSMTILGTGIFALFHPNATQSNLNALFVIWLLYLVGYAMLPMHAVFSAAHGYAPDRKDGWYINWLQTLSYAISGAPKPVTRASYMWNYRRFGVVYGTLRALAMVPGVVWLCYFTGSYVPLIGLLSLFLGVVFYGADLLSKHFIASGIMAIPLAEMFIGNWLGVYMLIVAMSC